MSNSSSSEMEAEKAEKNENKVPICNMCKKPLEPTELLIEQTKFTYKAIGGEKTCYCCLGCQLELQTKEA